MEEVEVFGAAKAVAEEARSERSERILTDEGKGFVEPKLAQHIKRISKYFSSLTELEKEILLKILTKLRKTVA